MDRLKYLKEETRGRENKKEKEKKKEGKLY